MVATGTPAPDYQWYKNDSSHPVGGNSSALPLQNVQPSDAANYYVIVSNSAGTVTSSTAALAVYPSGPTILTQPASRVVAQGGSVAFTVSASDATGYQWRKDGNNIAGANASSYSKTSLQLADAGLYSVFVYGTCSDVLSDSAYLTVFTDPISQTVSESDDVTFTVTTSGPLPVSYQWRKNGANSSGATAASLTLRNVVLGSDNANYSVQVSDLYGTIGYSADAALTIQAQQGDYLVLSGTRQGYTLRGDRTYYIPSGTVTLLGDTRIEGGTVVKYAPGTVAKLVINGPLDRVPGRFARRSSPGAMTTLSARPSRSRPARSRAITPASPSNSPPVPESRSTISASAKPPPPFTSWAQLARRSPTRSVTSSSATAPWRSRVKAPPATPVSWAWATS